ncbi:hypothetical protein [Halorubrum sp. AJ67]|uniref:hypothetical protein n=1 Tax=Halorubrum sp. AJ67 TaxID=1173487 RepID=UPI0003DD2361|nr:hypothetical protein [Halorubrum sp. AJ67]CDK39634.1 hypothetical protein BN903_33 [Halorubrum sp. AJ67]
MNLTDCFTDGDSDDSNDTVGSITVPLTDDNREFIASQAGDRNASYEEGKTTNEIWGDGDSASKHEIGFAGELAIAGLYESASIDTSVSASGDGGVDTEMRIEGETRTVDVKSATYDGPGASIMVQQDHAERFTTVLPEVYISCYVPDDLSCVKIRGWEYADEVILESNLKDAPGGDWINYDVACDDLRNMVEPTGDELTEDEDYHVVR